MPDPTIELLAKMAQHLEPLLKEVVFVGGCVTGLLITEGPVEVRATKDVDAVVATTSYADYVRISGRLRELGFAEDASAGAPICRWTIQSMVLDMMPHDEKILGFSNRWYKAAILKAEQRQLYNRLTVLVISAPYFVAAKLEAFNGRGNEDYAASHDLEDLIAVIDGRPSIITDIARESEDLRKYISSEFSRILQIRRFIDALPGFLLPDEANQARLPELVKKIEQLAKL